MNADSSEGVRVPPGPAHVPGAGPAHSGPVPTLGAANARAPRSLAQRKPPRQNYLKKGQPGSVNSTLSRYPLSPGMPLL